LGELLLEIEDEGPETGASVEVIIFRSEAKPPKFAFRLRFRVGGEGAWIDVGAEVWYGAGAVPFNLHTGTNP
jgi:hypothetical protein